MISLQRRHTEVRAIPHFLLPRELLNHIELLIMIYTLIESLCQRICDIFTIRPFSLVCSMRMDLSPPTSWALLFFSLSSSTLYKFPLPHFSGSFWCFSTTFRDVTPDGYKELGKSFTYLTLEKPRLKTPSQTEVDLITTCMKIA